MLAYVLPLTTTQALPTSMSTPTPTPYSGPPPFVTNLTIFPASLPQITTFLQKAQPTSIITLIPTVFEFPSTRYLPNDFFTPLDLHVNKFN